MLNLLRMDLYRLRKSKAVYICLGILLASIALVFLLLFLLLTPDGQAIAGKLGMLDYTDVQEAAEIFNDLSLLLVFRQSCMDGGSFAVITSILFAIFVCTDFKNGFIKNILSVHVSRWKYIGSKLLAFAVVDAAYLAAAYLFTILINLLTGGNVPYTGFSSVLLYLLQAWVITTAMFGLVLMVCMLTRSAAAGILTSVVLGSGLIVTILDVILGFFGRNGWLGHTLYMSLRDAPYAYQPQDALKGLLTGAVFLMIYTVIAAAALHKKDI